MPNLSTEVRHIADLVVSYKLTSRANLTAMNAKHRQLLRAYDPVMTLSSLKHFEQVYH